MTSQQEAAIAALHEAVDSRLGELIGILGDLVRFPSTLGNEAEVQAYVASFLNRSGMATSAWDMEDSLLELPNAGRSGVPFPGRPVVTGTRTSRSGSGRSLILNGHIDVVSPEPVEQWTHDPWGAEIEGNLMYGRGAFDMKSGVALNLFLARLVNDLGIDLAGDLHIHSVPEEECTGNGSLAASRSSRADAAVVTEPTGGTYCTGHVGVIWFRVFIEGKTAHVLHAWEGVNAIVKMAPIVLALKQLDDDFNLDIHPMWAGERHPVNLNVGVIKGGDWPSTVAGSCGIHCRVSFFPGTPIESVQRRIEQTVATVAQQDEWLREHPPVVSYDGFRTAGSIVEPGEAFLKVLGKAHELERGTPMEGLTSNAVNDMRYYLFEGIPATMYGATGGNGHAADEWVDLDSLAPTAKTLARFLVDWCGVD